MIVNVENKCGKRWHCKIHFSFCPPEPCALWMSGWVEWDANEGVGRRVNLNNNAVRLFTRCSHLGWHACGFWLVLISLPTGCWPSTPTPSHLALKIENIFKFEFTWNSFHITFGFVIQSSQTYLMPLENFKNKFVFEAWNWESEQV